MAADRVQNPAGGWEQPAAKADREIRNIRRRPIVSPSRPAGTRASPKVSAYPDTTHCTVPAETPNSRSIDGSATFTILMLADVAATRGWVRQALGGLSADDG